MKKGRTEGRKVKEGRKEGREVKEGKKTDDTLV